MSFFFLLAAIFLATPSLAQQATGTLRISSPAGEYVEYRVYSGTAAVVPEGIVQSTIKDHPLPPGFYQVRYDHCSKAVYIEAGQVTEVEVTDFCNQYSQFEQTTQEDTPSPGWILVYDRSRSDKVVYLIRDEAWTPLQFEYHQYGRSIGPREIQIKVEDVVENFQIVSDQTTYIEVSRDRDGQYQITNLAGPKFDWRGFLNAYEGVKHGPHLGYRFTHGRYSVGPSSTAANSQDTLLWGYGVRYSLFGLKTSGFVGSDPSMVNPRFAGLQFQGQLDLLGWAWFSYGWIMEWQGLNPETSWRYVHSGQIVSLETSFWQRLVQPGNPRSLLRVPRLGFGLVSAKG